MGPLAKDLRKTSMVHTLRRRQSLGTENHQAELDLEQGLQIRSSLKHGYDRMVISPWDSERAGVLLVMLFSPREGHHSLSMPLASTFRVKMKLRRN